MSYMTPSYRATSSAVNVVCMISVVFSMTTVPVVVVTSRVDVLGQLVMMPRTVGSSESSACAPTQRQLFALMVTGSGAIDASRGLFVGLALRNVARSSSSLDCERLASS